MDIVGRNKLLASCCLALLVFFFLSVGTRNKKRMMAQPRIGGYGAKREGPWPECIGLKGGACQRWIQAFAHDTRGHVEVLEEGSDVTDDFMPERVRIWIDTDTRLVNAAPRRG